MTALLLLFVLVAPDPAPSEAHARPSTLELSDSQPEKVPDVVGEKVMVAKTMMPAGVALKIDDPVTGLRAPVDADDPQFIKYQNPGGGTDLPSPIPVGYYVAVILDPGGESPGGSADEPPGFTLGDVVSWLTLVGVIALFFLWWKTHKHVVKLKPKE